MLYAALWCNLDVLSLIFPGPAVGFAFLATVVEGRFLWHNLGSLWPPARWADRRLRVLYGVNSYLLDWLLLSPLPSARRIGAAPWRMLMTS